MRRPVSIRRNHRTRDESRHRQPTARQTESPSILSSRPRLAVRKSFQTLDNGGQKRVTRLIFIEERAFTRSTAISIAGIISLLLVLLSSLVSLSFSFSFRSDRSIDSPFFSLLFNPRSTVHFLIVSNRSNHRRLSVPTIRRMTDHETHRSNKTRQITRSRAFQARIGESRQVEQLSDILENESRIIRGHFHPNGFEDSSRRDSDFLHSDFCYFAVTRYTRSTNSDKNHCIRHLRGLWFETGIAEGDNKR